MQDYVGKQIDRYRITERLGMGGMAVVYKAYDTRLERDVALKLIRMGSIPPNQYERLMMRFTREAKAQASFSHSNIVPVFNYGEFAGTPYLVMAYISGGTLKTKVGLPIPYQQALTWLIPVADALAYAHGLGVVHRDIKPSNILFDLDDQPTLTDFGVAKVFETDEATLTGTGLGVGTPEYMAPEQWRGQASPATDQYALGVVLYELLTGKKPYTADTPAGVAILQATEPMRSPRALVQDIPAGVERLLNKAMARHPQDRYENMNVLRNIMEEQVTEGLPAPESTLSLPLNRKPEPEEDLSSEAETKDLIKPSLNEVQLELAQRKTQANIEKGGQRKAVFTIGAVMLILLVIGIMFGVHLLTREPRPISNAKHGSTQIAPAMKDIPEPSATDLSMPTAPAMALPSPTSTQTTSPTLTPTNVPTFEIGSTMVNPIDGAVMVYVPEGEFFLRPHPPIETYLDEFWIYQTEVTNAQFAEFVQSLDYQTLAERRGVSYVHTKRTKNSSLGGEAINGAYWEAPQGPGSTIENELDHPVVHVGYEEAIDYCEWAGARLPTYAEWEKAAKGTNQRTFPWGGDVLSFGKTNFCDLKCNLDRKYTLINDGFARTAPVGSFPDGASPYGALDMAGNVWEWAIDSDNHVNFAYPLNAVALGGSWASAYSDLAWGIGTSHIMDTYDDVGFRCVYSITP